MFENSIKRSKPMESNFELQITALIDTLVIILIFLLKSIATDTLDIEQSKNLSIPSVFNGISSGKGDKLNISTENISWNGKNIALLNELVDGGNSWLILNEAIATTAREEKTNSSFDGKLMLQADKKTPFILLSKILKIAKNNGYKDIRFIGVRYN